MTPAEALHNAAALMLLLGPQESASIFARLPPQQTQQLKAVIAELAKRPKQEIKSPVDVNFDEFEDPGLRQSRLVADSSRYVRAMLKEAFAAPSNAAHEVWEDDMGDAASVGTLGRVVGEAQVRNRSETDSPPFGQNAQAISEEFQGARARGIDKLRHAELPVIVQLLVAEHPQIAAAMVTLLDLDRSTRVLQNIPPRQRAEILQRVAGTHAVNPLALTLLDERLESLLDELETKRNGAQLGARRAAMLIGGLGAHMEAAVLESIDNTDPALAQRIVDKMVEDSQ